MLLRTASLAVATTLALGAPAALAAPVAPVAAETDVTRVKAPISNPADASGYAEREKEDQKTADFQGGDMVVIGVSGGAILVLLLLLLVLA